MHRAKDILLALLASSIMHSYPAGSVCSLPTNSLKSSTCVHYDNPFRMLFHAALVVAVSMTLLFEELANKTIRTIHM